MKADAVSLLAIFEPRLQLEVPLFQRQYVWNHTDHWDPLWEDIARKFTSFVEGHHDAPPHFLGAMVLDQQQLPVTHTPKRQVIDGQQRLTTLQIFLAVFRDFSRANDNEAIAAECDTYTINRGMMKNPEVDRFKVWPTQVDRAQFVDVMTAGSRTTLEQTHPLQWKKYARKPEPRPRMVEAYLYFYDELTAFLLGTPAEPPLASTTPLEQRLLACLQALRNSLQVVEIDLDRNDDAQVIFETLNARGEPLLPADLLRNDVFLRAARGGEPQEQLYAAHWARFDDPFWRVEVKQGRLLRPRSDLFLQHFLASRTCTDIPVKHLFVEYKHWLTKSDPPPYANVAEELATLARQGDQFRRIVEPVKGDPIYGLATFLDAFDIRTAYPLLLAFLDAPQAAVEWAAISTTLESYLLRRAVCGGTTKNYNRVFLSLTRQLRQRGVTAETLRAHLLEMRGDSTEWPTDAEFAVRWRTAPAYFTLGTAKLVHVLKRISDTLIDARMEAISIDGPLTIEHIMPQSWEDHWPLPDGSRGLTTDGSGTDEDESPRAMATRARHEAVHTIGNLTVITQSLNSLTTNAAWPDKKERLLRYTVLPINQALHRWATWDERMITERGDEFLARALRIWPRG